MLAWCQVTWSSIWRAHPWCSPRRPQQMAPPGCQPDTWDKINWIMNFRKKTVIEKNRKYVKIMDNLWSSKLFEILGQSLSYLRCAALLKSCWHRVQSPLSSMINTFQSEWLLPCHSDHVPGPADLLLEGGPALQPHVGRGGPQHSVTKIQPEKDTACWWLLLLSKVLTTHQQILGRFEGEENDESVGINFDGYRVRWWWRCRPSTH